MVDAVALVPPAGVDRVGPEISAEVSLDRSAWTVLREQGPVFQDTLGLYCITSPSGCQYVLQHPEIFSSDLAYGFEKTPFKLIPIAVDPPNHSYYRRALSESFAPRRITALEQNLRDQVNRLIDDFIDDGHVDVMSQLAGLFPTQVFLTLFGLPLGDRDMIVSWVNTLNSNTDFKANHGDGDGHDPVAQASQSMTNYVQALIDERRKNPTDDIFGRVVALTGDEAWSNDDLLGFGFIFLLAGLDTVVAATGFLFAYLARHPEIRQRVIADDAALDRLIEEILRLETVAPHIPRVTTVEAVVDGYVIPAGAFVLAYAGVANRDPETFTNPDEVDLDRKDKGHFTFGGGAHRCIGSHLARSEMRIVTQEFHKRITDYSLAEGAKPRVRWPAGTIKYDAVPLVFAV